MLQNPHSIALGTLQAEVADATRLINWLKLSMKVSTTAAEGITTSLSS
jgi:hypothetical protein